MAVINLGIDLGSTGLRAAYALPDEAARVVVPTSSEWPWLLCEAGTEDALPVSFPSLKSKLGIASVVEASGKRASPVDVLAQSLDALRERIVAETSASIGQTVISVPARYFSTQRTALLEAAGLAGLHDVSLITDSVAAVIGQSDGTGTGTFLVYGMGYEGFEVGLVRAVRGRYRVLGYEGAMAPSGNTFDAKVLYEWLAVLRHHGALPDEVRHGDVGWRRLREIAEGVKKKLATGRRPVLFPMFAPGPDGDMRLTVQFDSPPFDRLVRSLVDRTFDRVTALFDQVGLTKENIELVLLVGGSTKMPRLRELVGDLGTRLVPATDELIARGALLHAHQRTRQPDPAYEEPPATTATPSTESVLQAIPLGATLLTAPGGPPVAEPPGVTTLDTARRLIKAGRVNEARDELNRLITQAQGLLAEIAVSQPEETKSSGAKDNGPLGTASAAELLAAARKRFAKGQLAEAISLAHLAWQREPERPDVFEAMLDIHCDAATANVTVRSFHRDETWLRCALTHDPSNARIRSLLAERIYLHGKELNSKGEKEEARKALQHALAWDPDHKAADDLLRQFGSRR